VDSFISTIGVDFVSVVPRRAHSGDGRIDELATLAFPLRPPHGGRHDPSLRHGPELGVAGPGGVPPVVLCREVEYDGHGVRRVLAAQRFKSVKIEGKSVKLQIVSTL